MGNAIDSLLRDTGQEVWELQITGSTAGDTLLDVPVSVLKKHRVYGIFRLATVELLEKIGTSTQGDAVFWSREKLNLTSQLEHNDIRYEMTEEIPIDPLHTGMSWVYILHRYGKPS